MQPGDDTRRWPGCDTILEIQVPGSAPCTVVVSSRDESFNLDIDALQRRKILKAATAAGLAGSAFALSSARAAAAPTGSDSEGPFYPVTEIPVRGNLLLQSQHVGDGLALTGRVVDTSGAVMPSARVEIWQCDGRGVYLHPADAPESFDTAFAGFGAAICASDGGYEFTTIVPVRYAGRPPHIHAKVFYPDGAEALTTQIYLQGHRGPSNRKIDPQADGTPDDGIPYAAQFDFVIR